METGEQFCQEFLPSLLFLLSDPVPNVRLSLARTLSQCVLMTGTVYHDDDRLLATVFLRMRTGGGSYVTKKSTSRILGCFPSMD